MAANRGGLNCWPTHTHTHRHTHTDTHTQTSTRAQNLAQLIAAKTGACVAKGRQLGTLAGTKRTIQQANFVKTTNFPTPLIVQLFSKVRVRKHN